MAKIKSDRLIKKYGTNNIHTGKYQELMNEVLANNQEAISRAILRQSRVSWDKGLKKITTKEKQFIMPSIEEVLPKRSIFVNKSAESGKFILDTLKDRLTKDLRSTLDTFTEKTGEQRYIRRRGKLAGTINPKVINDFQKSIRNTFENYRKTDPKYGMPTNIHNIAVTEVRTTINNAKRLYTETLLRKNKDLKARKKWRHNASLSKEERRGHAEADGQEVGFNELFTINTYRKVKGKLIYTGKVQCQHPHSDDLDIGEKCGCNCDYYIIVRRKA
jgi:hypothetical protein